jgi:hypothetical protein
MWQHPTFVQTVQCQNFLHDFEFDSLQISPQVNLFPQAEYKVPYQGQPLSFVQQ